jgi:hypothetical protein
LISRQDERDIPQVVLAGAFDDDVRSRHVPAISVAEVTGLPAGGGGVDFREGPRSLPESCQGPGGDGLLS